MKKLSFLLYPIIAVTFCIVIICLSTQNLQAQTAVSLHVIRAQYISKPTNPEITAEGKININTASKETLMLLNGIAESLSQRIIDYREENGPFSDVNDLLNVKGFGEKKLDAIITQIAIA